MKKIVENDDEIIGKVKDVIDYFKKEMLHQIKEIDIFDDNVDCSYIEDVEDNLHLISELINGLYQDYIMEILSEETLIKVVFNPMGAYQYAIYEEEI